MRWTRYGIGVDESAAVPTDSIEADVLGNFPGNAFVCLAAVLLFPFAAHAADIKDDEKNPAPFDAQIKCANHVAQHFGKIGPSVVANHLVNITSHYNTRLNRCIVYIEDSYFSDDNKKVISLSTI